MTTDNGLPGLLKGFEGTDKLLNVYINPDEADVFFVGSVARMEAGMLLLHLRGHHGEDEGLLLVPVDRVLQVSTTNDYLHAIQMLASREQNCGNKHAKFEKGLGPLSFRTFLERAKQMSVVVTIHDDRDEQRDGFVRDVSNGLVDIEHLHEHGQSEGRYIMPLEALARVDIGNHVHESLLFLYMKRIGLSE